MNPIVVALATERLTRLIVEDELTRPAREVVNTWAKGAPEFSVKDRVAVLISCPACMSVWSAAAVLLASRFRAGRPLVNILAASAAALLAKGVADKLSPEA
jgi:hypothetical protein